MAPNKHVSPVINGNYNSVQQMNGRFSLQDEDQEEDFTQLFFVTTYTNFDCLGECDLYRLY